MKTGFRIHLIVVGLLLLCFCAGTVAGTSLGIVWKEPLLTDSPFSGVLFSSDGSTVFAGGNQLLVRSWTGDLRWGGRGGSVGTMSPDGEYVLSTVGKSMVLLNSSGIEIWTRNMNALIRAVAITRNGSLVISGDAEGNLNAWANNGEFIGRTKDEPVKNIAISPSGNLVVVTSERGLRYFNPALDMVWSDNKSGSLDTFIEISDDGSTIITAGGTRVSSHSNTGARNWMIDDVTKNAITDLACSEDCSVIVIGSQDKIVQAMDRYGMIHWTYPAEQWISAVGVSRHASVIAAGSVDRTVYILDHGGNLLTKKKMESIIQPRSVAVSRDGERIALADEHNLIGLELLGNSDLTDTPTTPPPVSYTVETTNPSAGVMTTLPSVRPSVQPASSPVEPTSTPKAPLSTGCAILAAACGMLVFRRLTG